MAIKKAPSDFQVDEVLAEAVRERLAPEGPFALYRLAKEGLATPEAAGLAARTLGAGGGAIAYAGLKDKHARTTQHVTLKLAGLKQPPPERAQGPHWSMERLGFLAEPLTAEAIAANRFRIVLRNLTRETCGDMDQAAELFGHGEAGAWSLRVVNYFGDQRFGSARHGQGFLAKHLIKGDFERALKLAIATESRKDRREDKDAKRLLASRWGQWDEIAKKLPRRNSPERRAVERLVHSSRDFRAAFAALPYFQQQLCVYAYQSHLWNAVARQLVAGRCADAGPVLEAEDPFGAMLFPALAAIPEDLAGLDLPLLGYKTEPAGAWKDAAEEVLAAEGITTAELRIPGLRRPFFGEAPRALFVEAAGFVMDPPAPDETAEPQKERSRKAARFKRVVSFELPRGAYATVVLRALGQ
ncbi:MAG: tRNA pseudouridine(13) synthase TruD [Planctomycetota bacterium]|nr:tRNA pseudouridine(13) synthase TruD [Planctomycetota bacterium]